MARNGATGVVGGAGRHGADTRWRSQERSR